MVERYYRKHEIIKIIKEASARLRYVGVEEKDAIQNNQRCNGVKELELLLIEDFDTIAENLKIKKKEGDE